MTPATRLLEAARASTRNASPRENLTERERELLDAVEALSDARALYPAAHAIGERVSVVGEGYSAQTGAVTAVQFSEDQILYAIDYGTGWVPATFVHPAPEPPDRRWTAADLDNQVVIARGTVDAEGRTTSVQPAPRTLPLYRAPGVSGGPDWTVEEIVLDSQPAPSWFPMDGRRVTEESPGEAPYKPVTDKDRRESIARAVIRSKPGSEGGACDIDYRAAALVLFNLLDDIDTLDDACRENDAAFRRLAMVKARRREDVGASFDGYTVAFIGEASYAEGEKRTSEPSRAEESPTSSIADVQKTTFDPAVHGNTFGCLRLGGHIFDRCQRAADHEGPCVPASKPCPDCGTPPSRPHQPGCPTAAKQW